VKQLLKRNRKEKREKRKEDRGSHGLTNIFFYFQQGLPLFGISNFIIGDFLTFGNSIRQGNFRSAKFLRARILNNEPNDHSPC
jgi:hypothetical protein